ncbi:transcription factor MAMYB [Benincasa hispida]|uniref:transcription factor MAMYB n=1 Tax=Benincasa hispida TaxID=102211 RepID=UPI0018FF64CE|nr:transcription factor MAMYB [Benincasa hispida]XP_038887709.1 transcription factor MAMYB [Benincasa hispida]XP_038887710.1 transcription factor MAMYB [Benincasa hispida]XP_038887711.1 transcription factor MAMYB [Benincasa hispida]XP_038887712.1 transcription factor MAMYB [Benincasa hispida]XP_038887713.1 transcription factor MAMYB [Benincasa hispida]
MEFLDEDAKPRFLFHSRANPSSATELQTESQSSKLFVSITVVISSIFLILSILFVQFEPFRSLLIWLSLSLLLGPFAPISLTGGDIRVGRGPILEIPNEEPEVEDDAKKKPVQKRSKPRRSEEIAVGTIEVAEKASSKIENRNGGVYQSNKNGVDFAIEEAEWDEAELGFLKKQLTKHPVGKPRRWEIIAEAFGGRHKVENVIKMAKEMGEKKLGDEDSYAQFLKKRKPMDKRIENVNEEGATAVVDGQVAGWSSGEDIALLNALKTFPKDSALRWEKIAAAVPGKTKAACMKRVGELKRDFRNSKAANDI